MPPTRLTRQQSQEQTRQRLLDAAIEVFIEKGFARSSVEEIAERAGYSKGAVYSNFASKEQLALAVLDRRIDQQIEVLTAQMPEQGDDPMFWINQGETGLEGQWEPLLIELWVQGQYDAQLREQLATQRKRILDNIGRILAGGGRPTQQQTDAVIMTLALSSGLAMQYAVDPDPHLMELFAETIVRLYNELNSPNDTP